MDARYTPHEIRRYEAIFGRDFISVGGEAAARRFLTLAAPARGSAVLDVGCGVGGAAFMLAREWGCRVDGIDLAREMVREARARAADLGLDGQVTFHEGDCLTYAYPRTDYALVHSRDTFLHIADKPRLFATLRGLMAPGATLVFTDYLKGPAPASPEFEAYIAAHGYALVTLASYRAVLAAAGFQVDRADDLTRDFVAIHHHELARLPGTDLSPADVDYLTQRWQAKIGRAERAEQGWGLFLAKAA